MAKHNIIWLNPEVRNAGDRDAAMAPAGDRSVKDGLQVTQTAAIEGLNFLTLSLPVYMYQHLVRTCTVPAPVWVTL